MDEFSRSQIWVDIAQRHLGSYEDRLLLDLGCGDGALEAALFNPQQSEPDHGMISLDVDWAEISSTARLVHNVFELERPVFLQADGHYIPLQNECVDVVFCLAVLEHVQDYRIFVSEIVRVLKPGGYLFLYYGPNAKIPFDSPFHRKLVTQYLTPDQVRVILQPQFCWIKPIWAEIVEYRLYNTSFKASGHALYHWVLNVFIRVACLPFLRRIIVTLMKGLEQLDLQHGIAFVGRKQKR